jgi:hypothetical protein
LAPQVIENARFGLANGRSVGSVISADVRMRNRLSRAAPASSLIRAAGLRRHYFLSDDAPRANTPSATANSTAVNNGRFSARGAVWASKAAT